MAAKKTAKEKEVLEKVEEVQAEEYTAVVSDEEKDVNEVRKELENLDASSEETLKEPEKPKKTAKKMPKAPKKEPEEDKVDEKADEVKLSGTIALKEKRQELLEEKKTGKKAKAETPKDEKAEVKDEEKAPRKPSNILRERRKAISKDVEGDELIIEQAAFNTFSGAIASKERRQELLKDVTVITEDGEETVETLATIRNREYIELRGSAASGNILTGEVIGVRYTDPENPKSMVVADVRYKTGAIRVTIPAFLMFDYDEEKYVSAQGNKEIFEAIKKRINATIKFVASYVSQDEGTCVGDRLRASAMNSSRFYLNGWKGSDRPRVFPGLIVQGRIYAVGANYVIVDALGADIRVPKDELSYMYIGDARQKFNVSDMVNVYVTEVKEKNVTKGRNNYRLAHVKGSIKKAYPNMRKKYFDEFPIGLNTSATITYIDENAHVFCELSGGKIDCLCPFPQYGAVPVIGQKRVVQITGRDENEYRLFGTIQNT